MTGAAGDVSTGDLFLQTGASCQSDRLSSFGWVSGVSSSAHAFAVFDDGSGTALYVAGSFYLAGGLVAAGFARWDGAAWTSMTQSFPNSVRAL